MKDTAAPDPNCEITLRAIASSDFDAVRAIHQITFEEHLVREPTFDSDEPFIDQYLLRETSRWARFWDRVGGRRYQVLVAESADHVAGYIAYQMISPRARPEATLICDLSIAPSHRRSGAGAALVAEMERKSRMAGVKGTNATIWPNNKISQAFFAAQGYAVPDHFCIQDHDQILYFKELQTS